MGIIITVGGAALCSLLTAVGGAWGKGALTAIRLSRVGIRGTDAERHLFIGAVYRARRSEAQQT